MDVCIRRTYTGRKSTGERGFLPFDSFIIVQTGKKAKEEGTSLFIPTSVFRHTSILTNPRSTPPLYPLSLHSHTHACCAALYFCAFLYDPLSRFVFSVLSLFAEWPMDIWVPFPSITHVTVCVVFDCGSRHTCVHTGASQCVFLSVVCHAKIPGEYIRIHMRVNKLMHVCVCVCVVSSLSELLFTLSVATLTLTILSRTICPSINPKQPSIHNHLKHIQHHKDRLTQKHRQTQHLDQINQIT